MTESDDGGACPVATPTPRSSQSPKHSQSAPIQENPRNSKTQTRTQRPHFTQLAGASRKSFVADHSLLGHEPSTPVTCSPSPLVAADDVRSNEPNKAPAIIPEPGPRGVSSTLERAATSCINMTSAFSFRGSRTAPSAIFHSLDSPIAAAANTAYIATDDVNFDSIRDLTSEKASGGRHTMARHSIAAAQDLVGHHAEEEFAAQKPVKRRFTTGSRERAHKEGHTKGRHSHARAFSVTAR